MLMCCFKLKVSSKSEKTSPVMRSGVDVIERLSRKLANSSKKQRSSRCAVDNSNPQIC